MNMKKMLFFSMVMLISQSASALTVVVKNYFDKPVHVRPIYSGEAYNFSGGIYSKNDTKYPNYLKEQKYNTGVRHLQGLQVVYGSDKNSPTGQLQDKICRSFDFDTYAQISGKKLLRGLGTVTLNIVPHDINKEIPQVNVFGNTEAIPLAINQVNYFVQRSDICK
jgi:hypothetical protein